MTPAIPQARQLTAITAANLSTQREAQLSQTLMSRPAAAKTDNGKAALNLLVEQQIQADSILRQKQALAANNRLSDLVAKEGNAQDLQTIIAIDRQKDMLEDDSTDETIDIMLTATEEQPQERDTPASRMAKQIQAKATEEAKAKAAEEANTKTTDKEQTPCEKKIQAVIQWCSRHLALVVILLFALLAVVQYYCSKSLDH